MVDTRRWEAWHCGGDAGGMEDGAGEATLQRRGVGHWWRRRLMVGKAAPKGLGATSQSLEMMSRHLVMASASGPMVSEALCPRP